MRVPFVRFAQAVQALPRTTAFITGLSLMLLVAVADAITAPVYSFSLLYLLGIGFVGWTCGSLAAVGVAILASAITAGLYNTTNFDVSQFLWNVGMRSIMFCAGGWAIGELTRLYRERGDLAAERTRQLHQEIEHHKATAAQLAEAVERFEQVTNNIAQVFWLTGIDPPEIHYVSPAYEQIYGRPRAELVGNPRKWLDYVHPDDRTEITRYFAQPEIPVALDLRIVRPDKELRWVRIHSFPVRDGTGRVIRRAGITEDITHRRSAELSLHRQDEQHRRMLATAMDGFLLVDQAARIKEVNEAYCRMTGFTRDELLQKTVMDIELKHPPESVAEGLKKIRANGSARFETRHRTRNGAGLHVEVSASVVPETEETICCFIRDITQRSQAELSLRLQKEAAARLSVATETGAALSDVLRTLLQLETLHWACAHVFDPATGSFRFAAEKGISVPFSQHLVSFAADSPQALVIRKGEPVYLVRAQFFPADGDFGTLRSGAIIPLAHERKIVAALAIGSESLDEFPPFERAVLESIAAQAAGAIARIQAEQERQQLQTQLLDIADREQARIGQEIHDGLCQQLVSLAFDANALQEHLATAPRRTLATACRLAHYLDLAITESRNLSRGLFPVRLEGDALSSALKELARSTQERFHLPCSATLDNVIVPARIGMQLYRIAQEAISNAVKHGRASQISLELGTDHNGICMVIRDNGRGFHLPVPRVDAGMGLHIMEYRARAIGATLRIDSNPGAGTTVFCCLPAAQDQKIFS